MTRTKSRGVRTMRMLVVPVGGEPYTTEIPDRNPEQYDALRDLIGGWLELLPIGKNVVIVADEEGRLKGLPFNRCGIVGTFVIAAETGKGNFRSLTDAQVAKAIKWIDRHKDERPAE